MISFWANLIIFWIISNATESKMTKFIPLSFAKNKTATISNIVVPILNNKNKDRALSALVRPRSLTADNHHLQYCYVLSIPYQLPRSRTERYWGIIFTIHKQPIAPIVFLSTYNLFYQILFSIRFIIRFLSHYWGPLWGENIYFWRLCFFDLDLKKTNGSCMSALFFEAWG